MESGRRGKWRVEGEGVKSGRRGSEEWKGGASRE